jgi:hypothetical protein
VCGPGGACPESYHCATDNHCHLDGTAADLTCAADAAIDVLPIDVPIPPDTIPPRVFTTMPGGNEANVPVTTTLAVQFTEEVINVDAVSFLVDNGGSVTGAIAPLGTNMQVWVFTPDAPFTANSTVSASVTMAITDLAGNPLEFAYGWAFQTAP